MEECQRTQEEKPKSFLETFFLPWKEHRVHLREVEDAFLGLLRDVGMMWFVPLHSRVQCGLCLFSSSCLLVREEEECRNFLPVFACHRVFVRLSCSSSVTRCFLQFLSTLYKEVAERESSGESSAKCAFVKKLLQNSLQMRVHMSEESIASKLAGLSP